MQSKRYAVMPSRNHEENLLGLTEMSISDTFGLSIHLEPQWVEALPPPLEDNNGQCTIIATKWISLFLSW